MGVYMETEGMFHLMDWIMFLGIDSLGSPSAGMPASMALTLERGGTRHRIVVSHETVYRLRRACGIKRNTGRRNLVRSLRLKMLVIESNKPRITPVCKKDHLLFF
jgi:hypothetical protein